MRRIPHEDQVSDFPKIRIEVISVEQGIVKKIQDPLARVAILKPRRKSIAPL
jgi:hypothetical protein